MLQTESARLLIVARVISHQQFVTAPLNDGEPITFTIHGTPKSDRAYMVAPHGVTPIPVQRGGGLQVTLEAAQPLSLVLVTQDPRAINYAARQSAEVRREFAARQLEVAESLLDETESLVRQLAQRLVSNPLSDPELVRARADLRQARRLVDSGDAGQVIQLAARSREACRRLRREHWESAILQFPSPVSSPLCTSFATLPAHYVAAQRLAGSPWSVNVLAAGDFEYLEHLISSGWRQQRTEVEGIAQDVQLTPHAPRSGRSCLQMRAWSDGHDQAPLSGQWPITITSAPVQVREGQLVRIHGWAKVPLQFPDSWDGLMIFDSQTGTPLAERILETQGWQEFLLYRVARQSGELRLVIALTGLGECWLDEVSIALQDRSGEPLHPDDPTSGAASSGEPRSASSK
jgi:hypothetical protein